MKTESVGSSRGSTRSAAMNPTVPSTMLIRKIGRQVRPPMFALMMNPARIGPTMADAPITGPNTENAVRI